MPAIYIDFDSICLNDQKSFPIAKNWVADFSKFDSILTLFSLTELSDSNKQQPLVINIPYFYYENKNTCNNILTYFQTKYPHLSVYLISDIEAIASYLLKKQPHTDVDGTYSVFDFGLNCAYLHEFKIEKSLFYHINSTKIELNGDWSITESVGQIKDEILSSLPPDLLESKLLDVYREINKEDWDDNFDDFPIITGSRILYRQVKDIFTTITSNWDNLIKRKTEAKSSKILFCGHELSIELVSNAHLGDKIEDPLLCKLMGGQCWSDSMYPYIQQNISLQTYGVHPFRNIIVPKNTKIAKTTFDYWGQNANSIYELSVLRNDSDVATLEFYYGNHKIPFTFDWQFTNDLPVWDNGKYTWRNVGLGVSVDGCQNIVASILDKNKNVLHSVIAGKI